MWPGRACAATSPTFLATSLSRTRYASSVDVAPVSADPSPADPQISTAARLGRWSELVGIFVGLPLAYFLGAIHIHPVAAAVLLAAASLLLLRTDRSFDRRLLWNAAGLKRELPRILALFAVGAVSIAGAVAFFSPQRLFALPRQHPGMWLLVLTVYPLLSIFPQEILYRAYFCHRYRPLLGAGGGMVAASAVAFGSMHILFGNWIAVGLTALGGALFSRRYLASRSLLAASVEHALYGQWVFTIGLGEFFYHGSQSVAARIVS
jgi:membrane protease YdiL (CAAX protease family)